MGPEVSRVQVKDRVKAENTLVLPQGASAHEKSSHGSCAMHFCSDTVKSVFFFDIMGEKSTC